MKSWVLAAGLLAAAAVPAAWAADVDDGPPPPKSGPYGVYKGPKGPPPGGPPPYFDDDDDDGPGGPPPSKKYSEGSPYGQKCVRSEQVREQLSSLGWSDFHEGQKQGASLVTLKARRPSGRLFELTLHRCSGQIVDAAPLEARRFGSYAYKGPSGPYAYDGPPRRGPHFYRQFEDGPWYNDRPNRRWYRYRD